MNESREFEIKRLKKKLATYYIYSMCGVTLFFALVYYGKDNVVVGINLFFCLVMFCSWTIIKTIFSIENIVKVYLILAPLLVSFSIIVFWEISLAQFVWLVPMPFAAYVFLKKKEIVAYTIYPLVLIILLNFFKQLFVFQIDPPDMETAKFTDSVTFIFAIVIIALLSYYQDKIRTLEVMSNIEIKEKIILPVTLDERDLFYSEELFGKIEREMNENLLFKNSDFNISLLSSVLKTNNSYISKAIRYKEYNNFNSYVNSHRIDYVKQMMNEVDLNKVTLMYIYTEAGFINQSTFNRVFKQFEGVTPTEYIQKLKKE